MRQSPQMNGDLHIAALWSESAGMIFMTDIYTRRFPYFGKGDYVCVRVKSATSQINACKRDLPLLVRYPS